jgi:hypothetical protein
MTGQEASLESIRRTLRAGALPRPQKYEVYAGYSAGRTCQGCDERIEAGDMEHEVVFEAGGALALHASCFRFWRTIEA